MVSRVSHIFLLSGGGLSDLGKEMYFWSEQQLGFSESIDYRLIGVSVLGNKALVKTATIHVAIGCKKLVSLLIGFH